ncbi:cytochrome c-type biogenesis protein [Variovorax sp. Sphag1AA]|uniref:cytochrome c-type biogenesis protein n=1 Tax=Variovorax sp. Sphag1AA TaxID=2587027 RepID=UPI00160BDE36|nr:cytochrome c-type biogenesis protein [Variovorax sp. Sphag1AA]MBB3176871.1 cytochrome c-type biogenesis protein CcmH [Variovorax sp. Sphag1AA]
MRSGITALLFALTLASAFASPTDDEQLDARVHALSHELRCVVCQNQTLADSQADLAVDLRRQIREQMRAGKSDAAVKDFLVQRYGDFVLYKPPLKPVTLLLWFGPLLLLVIVAAAIVSNRRRASPSTAPLGEADRQRLDALLDRSPESPQ